MATSFTGAYLSRDATDNTSLYITLYGGTDVPAANEYDQSKSSFFSEFKFSYPDSVTSPSFQGLSNQINAGNWIWNANRTEVTIPMAYNLNDGITENQYGEGYTIAGTGGEFTSLSWYPYLYETPFADLDTTDWKLVDSIATGYYAALYADGVTISFKDSNNNDVDSWDSWNNTSGTPNTYNGGNMQIFNSPVGTSGRKNVYDSGGFLYSGISLNGSSGGASGDPHITTFGGDRYTL